MKVTARDLKIIKSLKPSPERIMVLYEVTFRGPNEQPVTVQVAANDELEAAHRVRNGVNLVDGIDYVRHMGYVSVPV
jgi:hypothetical protein